MDTCNFGARWDWNIEIQIKQPIIQRIYLNNFPSISIPYKLHHYPPSSQLQIDLD
jgi:hypothetical protein